MEATMAQCCGNTTYDDVEKALVDFKSRILANPADIEAQIALGGIYVFLSMNHEAEFVAGRILAADPASKAARFIIAQAMYNTGREAEGRRLLEEIVACDQPFLPAVKLMSNIVKDENDCEKLFDLHKILADSDPSNPEYIYLLGNSYDDNGDLENAISCYEKSIEIAPGFPLAYNALGLLKLDEFDGDADSIDNAPLDEAIALFRKALAIDPSYSNAHLNLATAYQMHYDYNDDDAIDEFQLAAHFDPQNADALVEIGNIFMENGEIDKAIDLFEKAVIADEKSSSAYIALGEAYMDEGDFEEAYTAFQRGAQIIADDPELIYGMAKCKANLGDEFDASILLRIYIAHDLSEYASEAAQLLDSLDRVYAA